MVTNIKAGLTTRFDVSYSQYPTTTFNQATLFLRGPGKLDIAAVVVGSAFQFNVSSVETKALAPGLYAFEIHVSDGVDAYCAEKGRVNVEQDITTLDSFDARTDDEKSLEAIRAVLSNRATSDQQRITFNGRELEKTPIPELLRLERHFLFRVNESQRRKKGGKLLKHLPYRMK
jgi:hypothetical protein